MGTENGKKKKQVGEWLFFACRSVFSIKGKKGAVGMKVNNMHDFVKKINNAAFVGSIFLFNIYFLMSEQQSVMRQKPKQMKCGLMSCSTLNIPAV